MVNQPATTAPDINTAMARSILKETAQVTEDFAAMVLELCDAIDTLRRHFEAQQVYINSLERKQNA